MKRHTGLYEKKVKIDEDAEHDDEFFRSRLQHRRGMPNAILPFCKPAHLRQHYGRLSL
jgi:hypothetical protein